MRRELRPGHRRDRPSAQPAPDHAVVVEHHLAVGGEPHVALEAGGAQPQGQRKASRVFSGAWARAPVGEADRRAGARGL